MNTIQIKKIAIQTMIASLIGAATIAVLAVLVGEFNEIFSKALFTLLIVTFHALACLGFLDNKVKTNNADNLNVFSNTIFVLIVLSFVTAVFGLWELLPGEVVGKLYGTYFVAAFAALHGEVLFKATGFSSTVDNIVKANYIFMAVVIILILPIIWVGFDVELPGFYYRLLAATAIVDATLTILAVILHKLYIQKHPELNGELFTQPTYITDAHGNQVLQNISVPKKGTHPLLFLLGLFLLLQFIVPIFFLIIGLG